MRRRIATVADEIGERAIDDCDNLGDPDVAPNRARMLGARKELAEGATKRSCLEAISRAVPTGIALPAATKDATR